MLTAVDSNKLISIVGEIKPPAINDRSGLPMCIVYTSMNRTLKALEKILEFANPIRTSIEIVAVHTVPFMLSLDEPPVPFKFIIRSLEKLVARFPEQTRISAYLCRDSLEALKRVLDHHCPVVMGIKKRWWPTRDQRLARKLRRAGYNVIIIETE